ncbi:hypothetical protein SprV_0401583900 [Sparganum proliferum]
MRPKAPLPRGETKNAIYQVHCSSCEANYVGETGKRLQTRINNHMRGVTRMDPLSLVAEHWTDSGHTFASQSAKILGRGNDRVAREAIEAWHTETTSINRCVPFPAAYQALWTQRNERKSKREVRPDVNTNTGEPTTDLHVATPQIESDEGAVINTVASTTTPAMEEENNGVLPFLDVQVPRQEDGTLQTGVFRKATDTEKILHYNSNHPLSHKRSCVRTLHRIHTHYSTEAEKLRERKTLWHLFLANGYPRSFVNKCLYRRHTKTDGEKRQKPEIFRVLPYVRNVSEATERMLRPLSVGVGHRPEATIAPLNYAA